MEEKELIGMTQMCHGNSLLTQSWSVKAGKMTLIEAGTLDRCLTLLGGVKDGLLGEQIFDPFPPGWGNGVRPCPRSEMPLSDFYIMTTWKKVDFHVDEKSMMQAIC